VVVVIVVVVYIHVPTYKSLTIQLFQLYTSSVDNEMSSEATRAQRLVCAEIQGSRRNMFRGRTARRFFGAQRQNGNPNWGPIGPKPQPEAKVYLW
jgi:hypothetical protein